MKERNLGRRVAAGVLVLGGVLSLPSRVSAEVTSKDAAQLCPKGPDVSAQVVVQAPDGTVDNSTKFFKTGGECVVFVNKVNKSPGFKVLSITPQ